MTQTIIKEESWSAQEKCKPINLTLPLITTLCSYVVTIPNSFQQALFDEKALSTLRTLHIKRKNRVISACNILKK